MTAKRHRIPMVGDHPEVVVPVEAPPLEVTLRVRREELSSEEAAEFDWNAWSGLMMTCLIVPRSVDALVDFWKANINLLDWAKKVKPEIFERVRIAFSERKKQLQGGHDG